MNREQLQKDFYPPEIMLKLFGDETELQDKLTLINNYIEGVRGTYDEDVLRIFQNNQIGYSYWLAGKHEQAIEHFKLVVENMHPEDNPSLYFLAINLLIRSNRMLPKIEEAFTWAIHALDNSNFASANYNLTSLKEYAEIIRDMNKDFDDKYLAVIQSVIDFFGISVEVKDPIERVKLIHQMHSYWAKRLTVLDANFRESDLDLMIREYEAYTSTCEIDWYKDYALKTLEILKIKKAQA